MAAAGLDWLYIGLIEILHDGDGQAILLGPVDGTVTIMGRRIFHAARTIGLESEDFCHHARVASLPRGPAMVAWVVECSLQWDAR